MLVAGATLLGGVGSQSRTSKLMFAEAADWGGGERALFPAFASSGTWWAVLHFLPIIRACQKSRTGVPTFPVEPRAREHSLHEVLGMLPGLWVGQSCLGS